jgi:hypothetical protein
MPGFGQPHTSGAAPNTGGDTMWRFLVCVSRSNPQQPFVINRE